MDKTVKYFVKNGKLQGKLKNLKKYNFRLAENCPKLGV